MREALREELRGLQMRKISAEHLLGEFRDRLQQRKGHILSDDGCHLQKLLLFGGEPVDSPREDCLYRGRNLNRLDALVKR